jgi:CRP-like cAMP-binding protein
LGSGHFLGEKALIQESPYQRLFSAKARTTTTVIEVGLHDVETIQQTMPQVMTDILKRAFQVAAERLAKANYMIRVLRSSDNLQRLVHCISYFCRSSGKRGQHGIEVEIAVESIHYYIDMDRPQIEAYLQEFVRERMLIPVGANLYQVPDLNALLAWAQRQPKAA